MFRGSCLCGSTTFTLDGELTSPRYCHCANCRKFAGTSPASWAMADSSKLFVTSSGAAVTGFDSGRGRRCFCSRCGSPVWFESLEHPEIVAIPLGVLDPDDAERSSIPTPRMHLWVRSRPEWCPIHDDLPQFEKGPASTMERSNEDL